MKKAVPTVVTYKEVKALYKQLGLIEPDKFAQKAIANNFKAWSNQDWITDSCEALVRRTGKTTYEILCTLAKYKAKKQPIMIQARRMEIAKNVQDQMLELIAKLGWAVPIIKFNSIQNPTFVKGFSGILHVDHTAKLL